ncbi:MAG: hypothetical protein ABEL76_16655 [Bradymonadaceae bacterium]
MSSAHVFYIPVIFLVGLLAGYFAGRRAAEVDLEEKRRRYRRRRNAAGGSDGPGDRDGEEADDTEPRRSDVTDGGANGAGGRGE